MLRRPALFAASLLVGLPLLAGCGAIFGQRYANFTAYYNTFYNAQRDFERAERAIIRADEVVDRTRFISLFPKADRPGAGRGGSGQQGFEAAIRRAADVLRDHAGSKWVDDALLLIGKSYFYQGNYDAAAQKFREVLSLEDGRHTDEAHFWLGRALTESQDYGDSVAALRQGLARENLGRRWAPLMRLALAENALRRGDLEPAAEGMRAGLEQLDDAELAARAYFLLGQVLDSLGEFDEAADAYGHALSLRPPPELTYAAELQRTLALTRSGRSEEALARVERLRRDDRYFQQRAEVELLRARSLVTAGQPDDARDLLLRLLYQPESGLRIDRVRGQVHYRLAEIYRDELRDRGRAAAHFDTAATAMSQSAAAARDAQTTREAILDARSLAEAFGSYARVHGRIAEMDSLLHLGALDDEAFAEAIEQIAEQRRQEALAAQRERRRLEDQQGFGQSPLTGGAPIGGEGTGPAGPGAQETGFLSFRDPVRVQESLIAFQSRWGDRPHVPDWRRQAAVRAGVAAGEAFDEDRPGALVEAAETPFNAIVDVSAVPRAPEAYLEMRTERALARYELGNVLFLTLEEPLAAAEWYQRVLDEDADLPVARRAQYALAEVHGSLGDRERAEAILQEISELPSDDPLVRAALERLGKPAPAPPPDSLELAKQQYAAAFRLWEEGRHQEALRGMLDVDAHFPQSEMAGRARLAAGMIYSQWAAPDMSMLLAAAPDGLLVPDTLREAADQVVAGDGFGDEELADALVREPEAESSAADASRQSDLEQDPGEPESPAPDEGELRNPASDAGAGQIGELPAASGAPDSTIMPLELLSQAHEVAADTTAAPPDAGPPEDGSQAADAAVGEDPEAPPRSWLEELYASIEHDFPGTPFADRAAKLREVLEAQRLELAVPPDDPPDPSPEEEPHLPDLPREPGSPDLPPDEFEEAALMGDQAVRAVAGGFSWAALATARQVEAQNRLVAFHNRGYRTALLSKVDDEGDTYIVLVGQFATEADALAARHALPLGTDQAGLEIVHLTPDLNLQSAEDLLAP